ncbi:insulinase family protein [Sphingobacteriales bacterium CHB3]|nr:insulinase family protein [Sphingobacteriales bacterium CHB3]
MKRLLLAALICSAFLSAAAQDVRIRVPYTRFVLPNGLNVILHQDRSTPTVAVNIYYLVGSGREKPGRTGFAHLFEHIMFEGSKNVPEGMFDRWLEAAGGNNNGSTNTDRTNYYETVPSNALELALFLESDRMGFLLDAMSPAKVDGQRDVVKNERRQSYENRPYGMAYLTLFEQLYPKAHPYSWPTIGSMADLTAASYEDVVNFFKDWYVPNNAVLAIAGDIDIEQTKKSVEKWFAGIPRGRNIPPIDPVAAYLESEKRLVMEDNVQLPRLYMTWHAPGVFTGMDATNDIMASVLAGGKNSRLYKRLVYDLQVAQDVSAYNYSMRLGSIFIIEVTARSGHTLQEIEKLVQEEIDRIKRENPAEREVQRAVNQYEASFLARLESVENKADQFNNYFQFTGNPDFFNEDLYRYKAVDADDITAAAKTFLHNDKRVVLSIVPKGKKDLAATYTQEVIKQ